MGFISGSLVGGSDMGPFSCYREAAAGAGLAELAVHIGEGRFQRLAVQAVADDLLPAEDEVLGLELIHALLFQIGLKLGPDGVGLGSSSFCWASMAWSFFTRFSIIFSVMVWSPFDLWGLHRRRWASVTRSQ